MLPSSQQCSTVPVSLVVRTQHSAIAFVLVRPSLTKCMKCRVSSRFWCIYGAKFVSMNPRCSPYVLFFQLPMHYQPQMQYVPLIDTGHGSLLVCGPCRAQAKVAVILSLPGLPKVQSPMCILGIGLPLFPWATLHLAVSCMPEFH